MVCGLTSKEGILHGLTWRRSMMYDKFWMLGMIDRAHGSMAWCMVCHGHITDIHKLAH